MLGVHLEGPYISPGKLGAQPDFTCAADALEVARLNASAPNGSSPLAPEIPGSMQAIQSLVAAGHRVRLGHTLGQLQDGVQALSRRARGFTHLFNAMTGLRHRQSLASWGPLWRTPSTLKSFPIYRRASCAPCALRCADPLFVCVTDSTAATGMPDGDYRLGRQRVTKCLGGVRLPDGTLAGSTLTMDQALRNLINVLGLDLCDASRRVSTYAADYIGATDRGRLVPGAWGDIVVLDRDLQVIDVLLEGVPIGRPAAD